MSKPNKRDLILDAMLSLMSDNLAQSASVSDVAKKAGIGKGSIYYYFKSKDEILDGVLERSYSQAIEQSWSLVQNEEMNALYKLECLFRLCVHPDLELHQSEMLNYLHLQDNVILHQKFLMITIREFKPILSDILIQGNNENILTCGYPEQTAEIIVSMLVFLLDRAMFPETQSEVQTKLEALADLLEKSMEVKKGSFRFLYQKQTGKS